MDIVWEKVVFWVLAIVLILVLLYFMVQQLSPDKTGAIGTFFGAVGNAGKSSTATVPS